MLEQNNEIIAEITPNERKIIETEIMPIQKTGRIYIPKHSELEGLDYESSGHTGFQRAGNYIEDDNYVHTDNNYTNEDKQKLVGLSNYDDTDIRNQINATNELVEELDRDISNLSNDVEALETEKADKTEIPDVSNFITKAVSNLENYYLKQETYTKEEVSNLIGQIKTTHFEVVENLPEAGEENIIYLVPKQEAEEEEDIYNEYIWTNNAYELIGTTKTDLTNYLTKLEYNTNKSDYVKDGLVNNSNVLTDEEKIKVEGWLGLAENYLTYYNTIPYQVSSDYNPTHKKYVDEADTLLRNRISEIELFKFPNATIVGSPTISNGQVSNFTSEDYLEFPFLVDFRNRNFEINFAFTTGLNIDLQQNILDSDFGLAFAIRNKHLVIALSFNGTSWATERTGSLTLQPQMTYRIRISWNGLSYKVQYSTDGGNTYIDDITFGGTQAPYPKQMFIGVGRLAQNYFEGSINLNYADVKINNNLIWQGMDDVGLATRMALDMSNIDEAGVNYINSLIDAKIGNIDTLLQSIDTGAGV